MRQPFTPDILVAADDPRALRRRFGLLHPLSKFAASGGVKDNVCADVILEFVSEKACAEPGSPMHGAAMWFLFESEQAFFVVCAKAGIDAEKLRSHLHLCQQLGPGEMGRGGGLKMTAWKITLWFFLVAACVFLLSAGLLAATLHSLDLGIHDSYFVILPSRLMLVSACLFIGALIILKTRPRH